MSDFKPMLAKDGDPSTLTYPVVVQPKLDGIRAAIVDGKLVSRTLKPIPNAEIRAALEHPEYEGLDGELIVGAPEADDCYRRTSSFVMSSSKTGEPEWCFCVFDKWDARGGFWERYGEAEKVVHRPASSARLFMVPSQNALDSETLEAYEAERIAEGHEGIIVRIPDAPYKFGRSGKKGPLLKVKRFVDFEARVVGVYEQMHNANEAKRNELGRTQRSTAKDGLVPAGVLGGLVLVGLNGPAEGIEFRCGTGFDAAMRADYWTNKDALAGLIAKVKSFPIGVKDKPRHPVFLGWRHPDDFANAALDSVSGWADTGAQDTGKATIVVLPPVEDA